VSETTNAVLLSVTTSVGVFTSLLPPFGEVRKSVGNPDMVNDVRMGELAAGSLVVTIGLIASSMVKNPTPAMVSIVFAGALVCMYESVLAATPKEKMNV